MPFPPIRVDNVIRPGRRRLAPGEIYCQIGNHPAGSIRYYDVNGLVVCRQHADQRQVRAMEGEDASTSETTEVRP